MNNQGIDNTDVVIISGPANDGHNVWTTNDYGVAFGNEVTYGATKNSIIVYYRASLCYLYYLSYLNFLNLNLYKISS